ncbi:MAG TPA: DUF4136 domain-containing protein [Thermoanaerobaculia bacterium]|nr:DUF4136 domain-containing protein [Thermoanaerobaculia bacterium]
MDRIDRSVFTGTPARRLVPRGLLPALTVAALLFLPGCASVRYSFDRDPALPIPAGASWAWAEPERGRDARARDGATPVNALVQGRIERAIAGALADKGFVRQPRAEAALLVEYYVSVEEREAVQRDVDPGLGRAIPVVRCGPGGCWRTWIYDTIVPPTVTYRPVTWREGTLIVDFVDRASGRLAARAVAEGEVRRDGVREEVLRERVARMLRDLPGAG